MDVVDDIRKNGLFNNFMKSVPIFKSNAAELFVPF